LSLIRENPWNPWFLFASGILWRILRYRFDFFALSFSLFLSATRSEHPASGIKHRYFLLAIAAALPIIVQNMQPVTHIVRRNKK